MLFAIFLFIYLLFQPFPVQAIYDPLSVPNNRYGIHVADPNDISETTTLINSTGGDWGYVTLVVQDNDMNTNKWQELFNVMRRKHLIPLVRLATHPVGDAWAIPQEVDIDKWVNFLQTLNWPIENQYVILFNEPNHAKEWGDTINPEGYGKLLIQFAKKLKASTPNFFILPAGLDASASNDGIAIDEADFIRRMIQANPDVFNYMDGWTSHSYPNPSFSGSPYGAGRGSLQTFLWEQDYLLQIGMTKKLPIFITETGWQHAEGKYFNQWLLMSAAVASYIQSASAGIWQHPNIVAVTPFVYNYQDEPFDHFSWKQLSSQTFYPMYQAYQNISKESGQPKQIETFTTSPSLFPDTLVINSNYTLETSITNTGQGILTPNDDYALDIADPSKQFSIFPDTIPLLEPHEQGIIRVMIKTPNKEGSYTLSFGIKHNSTIISIETKTITLIPPPSATLHVTLGWNRTGTAKGATVLIYDIDDTLLHKFTDIPIEHGSLNVTGLYQIIPGYKYRVVVLVPYFLPRQTVITMKENSNTWTFKRLYPFDFNRDGKLTIADIIALILLPPKDVFRVLMGL
jgi:hypothetical protein